MESVQANIPVLARAFDYAQEAKRQRELELQAAARTENTLNEQPANRVTFSQAAQTRLNEEKTHIANQATEVRNAERAAAAEERSKVMLQQHLEGVEKRAAAEKLREERDSAARLQTEVANKTVANTRKVMEKTANAAHRIREDATANAIEQRTLKSKELVGLAKAEDSSRTLEAQQKETNQFLEKQKRTVVVKNREENAENNAVAIEHSKKVKAATEHSKAETAKAMKMYQRIDSMGR